MSGSSKVISFLILTYWPLKLWTLLIPQRLPSLGKSSRRIANQTLAEEIDFDGFQPSLPGALPYQRNLYFKFLWKMLVCVVRILSSHGSLVCVAERVHALGQRTLGSRMYNSKLEVLLCERFRPGIPDIRMTVWPLSVSSLGLRGEDQG